MRRKAKTFETGRRPYGFWKKRKNRIEAVRKVVADLGLGRMPTQTEFVDNGYSGLIDAINDCDGGSTAMASDLKLKTDTRKPRGYWHDMDNLLFEARKAKRELGVDRLPSQTELWKRGYTSLSVSIGHNVEGGFFAFRKLLGEKPMRVENGTWQSLSFALKEAKRVKRKERWKTLPCNGTLREKGYVPLANAISKFHEGYEEFRLLLGENPEHVSMGAWKNRKFLVKKIKELMEEHNCDTLPSSTELREWGYSSVSAAISQYHGGFDKFRKSLGEKTRQFPSGSWQNLDFALERARQIKKEHNLHKLPRYDRLIKYEGGPSLAKSIVGDHGGFRKFRELLGEVVPVKSVEQFKEEIAKDRNLAMLSGAALMLNGSGSDVEEVIIHLYPDRFKTKEQLHEYIFRSREEIVSVINHGLTNLGSYIGEFTLVERSVLPILIGNGLEGVDTKQISGDLEDRMARSLQFTYSPRFNSDPSGVMSELRERTRESKGVIKNVYGKLRQHYLV